MTALEEKQAELDALQAAFDEYIASSRELEEELEAELSKCQNDLTKAESRNTALSSQLSSLSPQLTSLETQLSNITTQLRTETQRRIEAETKAEEAENVARRLESSTANNNISKDKKEEEELKWKEEREDLYERLAFVEEEAEDWKRELEVERERWREELEEVRGDLMVERSKTAVLNGGDGAADVNRGTSAADEVEDAIIAKGEETQQEEEHQGESSSKDQEYIKTLEDELELVTEQLIEAETKLSRAQAELEEAAAAVNVESADLNNSELVAELEKRVTELETESESLREELKKVKEELELALEELALSNEELKAAEEDAHASSEQFDMERKEFKEEINKLQSQLDKLSSEERSKDIQSKEWEEALLSSERQTEQFREQVAVLEKALENSKADCASLQNEMDELREAFDDASSREKAEVMEELLATRTREVEELKEEIANLTETNSSLSKTLERKEQQMKENLSNAAEALENSPSPSEIQLLREELDQAKNDLADERKKVEEVQSSVQDKVDIVRKELETAERELELTRSKLEEAERSTRMNSKSSEFSPGRSRVLRGLQTFEKAPSAHDPLDEDSSRSSEFYRSHALSRRILPHKSKSRARSCSPTTIQRLESDAEERCAATATLKDTCDKLENQRRMSFSMKDHLEKEIRQLQKQLLAKNGNDASSIEQRDQASDLILVSNEDRDVEEVLKSDSREVIAAEFRTLAKKISAQKTHNAELLTRILKLQGNIQVGCRIRPVLAEESQRGCREVAQALSETELGCFDERTRTWKSYIFDKVWGPDARQKDIFQDVEPMALSVVDGYNACIFAYGQTGSGKTYTMEGNKATGQYGISQRTIHKVFSILKDKAHQHKTSTAAEENSTESAQYEYSIELCMMEIYNDEVYDLLLPSMTKDIHGTSQRKSLDIRRSAENTVEIPGLTKVKATDVNEVLATMERGNSNRATSSTNLNEQSSRSHMILQVEVTSGVGEAKHKASLYLVDLAGSERVRKSEVEGRAMKEAQHINKSLSALGNVMEALDQKSSHVPYRDSKLTYLLQNSLGGNSRTMMIVNVCPSNVSYDESAFALKFATRVRRINLGTAHRNISAKNLQETIKHLNSQISLLSKSKERSDSQLLTLKKEKERIQEKLNKDAAARSNSKEEMKTLAVLRNSYHDITSRWQKEKAIREEKTLELEKTQEQLRRVQKDLTTVKRDHESIAKKMEDKENAIFELKKDLRSVKEELNTEKIRHRRSKVVQSRIPGPSAISSSKATSSYKSAIPVPSSTSIVNRANGATTSKPSSTSLPDSDIARIRSRVLKFLEENEPKKVDKIDILMKQYEGREYVLLEKMTKRCSKTPDKDKDANATETGSTVSTISDERPMSRQERALAAHKARMQGIKNRR